MSRARLNVFLEDDHARRLAQLAGMKGVSKSAIVAAALSSYLPPDGGDRREAGIAIRLGRPETGELTATKIGAMTFGLYANPDDIAETPETARAFIGSAGPMAGSSQQAAIERIAAGSPFGFHADHADIQLSLAAAGGGIAILPDFMVAGRSDLVAVASDGALPTREVWMVVHTDMRTAASIRAVMDCLAGKEPPRPNRAGDP